MNKGKMGKRDGSGGLGCRCCRHGAGGRVERLAILTSCVDVLYLRVVSIRVFVLYGEAWSCDRHCQDDGVL